MRSKAPRKGTLQFFLMSLLWFSPSENAMNTMNAMNTSFISGLSIVSLLKMQCQSNIPYIFFPHIFFIIELLWAVLYCLCQTITQKNENRLTFGERACVSRTSKLHAHKQASQCYLRILLLIWCLRRYKKLVLVISLLTDVLGSHIHHNWIYQTFCFF